MSNTSILITQPNFDKTTQYVSAWSEEVEEFSLKRGNKTITLKGRRSNRAEFESIIKKTVPQLVMLNGHGNDNEVAGQNNEVIIDLESAEEIIKGKIIYALSCSAAKVLGHRCIKKGAVAFIGYSKEYIFLHSHIKVSRPREDKRAALFFKPSNQIPISLIKGNTAQESYQDSKGILKRAILDLLNSETSNAERVCLPYLVWNYRHLTLLGYEEAKLS